MVQYAKGYTFLGGVALVQ